MRGRGARLREWARHGQTLVGREAEVANAQAMADRAVSQKYDPVLEQIEATTRNLELIRDDPTTSVEDKNRAQKQIDAKELQKQKVTEAANTSASNSSK